jgi:hypothetical protein
MEALKLASKSKNNVTALTRKSQIAEYGQLTEAELLKLFPLPRYFQVHFQYLHDNTTEFKTELDDLKKTAQQLNDKLDFLIQWVTQVPPRS